MSPYLYIYSIRYKQKGYPHLLGAFSDRTSSQPSFERLERIAIGRQEARNDRKP